MKTAREIAARVWCDHEMSKVAMDTDAAEQIAIIIQSVRQERAGPQGIPNRRNFDDELVCLLNKYSKENRSNTPDFILADFIDRCLENWNLTTKAREKWSEKTLQAEVERLKRGDFTSEEFQSLCHNRDECTPDEFFKGCKDYQRKLFGYCEGEEK